MNRTPAIMETGKPVSQLPEDKAAAKKRLFRHNRYPLWLLCVVGLGLILASSLLITAISVNSLRESISISDNIVDNHTAKMHQVMRVQSLVARYAITLQEYHNRRKPDIREQAARTNIETDNAFDSLGMLDWLPEQARIIHAGKREWVRIKSAGEKIMLAETPVASPRAASQTDELYTRTDRAMAELRRLYQLVEHEINRDHQELHNIKNTTPAILYFSLALVILLVVSGAAFVLNSVLPAINQFKRGVTLFSQGRFDHRISTDMPGELHSISRVLNYMAERLQINCNELEKQAMLDPLTGIYNKRKFNLDIRKEIERATRYRLVFSLLVIDLDHFKTINDSRGHAVGDKVLRSVTEVIRLQLRTTDTLYRIGGDEFSILLPESSPDTMSTAAARICSALAACSIPVGGGQDIPITTSIGISSFPEHGTDEDELFNAADAALYAAKRNGRNQFKTYQLPFDSVKNSAISSIV